jgi:MoaA/NifB/PqqE/SkfB family radical SAM enzyme
MDKPAQIKPLNEEPLTWVDRLLALLRKVDLPVIRLIAVDGTLDIEMSGSAGSVLRVEVRPRGTSLHPLATGERFEYTDRASADLPADDLRKIHLLVAVLQRLEPRLPASWQGVTVAGDPGHERPDIFNRRFPFATLDRATSEGTTDTEVLVRLTPRCNQRCEFCSAPSVEQPTRAQIVACLDWVAAHLPGAHVTLTGGEPTLSRDFRHVLRHALASPGIAGVQVQTNAVGFAAAGRVDALPLDDRLDYWVSLHALNPTIYDECTGTSGQLLPAIRGLRRLLSSGARVALNIVVCRYNLAHLPTLVRNLPIRLAGLPMPEIHFSTLICPDGRPDTADLLVRYTDLLPVVTAAAAIATRHGLAVQPLVGSSHAAIPPCLVPPNDRIRMVHRPEPMEGETGYEDLRNPWVKAFSCRTCVHSARCLGVPRDYVRRFGLAELRPIRQDDSLDDAGPLRAVVPLEPTFDRTGPIDTDGLAEIALSTKTALDFTFRLTRDSMARVGELVPLAARLALNPGCRASLVLELPDAGTRLPDGDAPVPYSALDTLPGPLNALRGEVVRVRVYGERPLCLFNEALSMALPVVTADGRTGKAPGGSVHGPLCADCAMLPACPGVSSSYATLFGTRELKPFFRTGPDGSIPEWEQRLRWLLLDRPAISVTLGEILPPALLPQIPCVLPWTRLELHDGGTVGPCCSDWMSVREATSRPLDLHALWSGQLMASFRESLLTADPSATCRASCPVLAGGTHKPAGLLLTGGPAAVVENQVRLVRALVEGRVKADWDPLTFCFAATSSCNYDCLMCDCGQRGTLSDQMPTTFYRDLEPWVERQVEMDVNGGEPLASPTFRTFLDRLAIPGAAALVGLVTNGSYLTPRRLARWQRLPFRAITVSLNAATPDTYLAVNRGLTWDRIRVNLEELLRLRRNGLWLGGLTWSMVILRRNVHEIRTFAEMALHDDVDVRFMLPAHDRNGQSIMTDATVMESARAALTDVANRLEALHRNRSARDARALVAVLADRLTRKVLDPL